MQFYSLLLIIFLALTVVLVIAFLVFRRSKYWKKQIERSLKMVPLLITVPRDSGSKDNHGQSRDNRDALKEVISVAETFYSNIGVTYNRHRFIRNYFVGTPHIAAEIVAKHNEIFFYFAVPFAYLDLVEKNISAQYPDCHIERSEEHNIFYEGWGLENISGGELLATKPYYFPFRTYHELDSEPLESLTNSLFKLDKEEGAAIQILFRPTSHRHSMRANQVAKSMQKGNRSTSLMTDLVDAALVKEADDKENYRLTPMEEETIKLVEKKSSKLNLETVIRVIASTSSKTRSDAIVRDICSAFEQFGNKNMNSFHFEEVNADKLATDYIFRFFHNRFFKSDIFSWFYGGRQLILNTEELATIFHLPNYLVTTPGIRWLPSKKAAPPTFVSETGVIIGHSYFRGEDKVIRIAENDRRRHVYIIGQTGSGKTTTMANMIISDIKEGKGVCFIDPHGQDLEEHILPYIPKERAEDVILFDASDVERPIGINLFSAQTQEEKDFVIQEAIAMLYRLYDPGHTGIMGPRFEHWFRNAALLLMSGADGGTFIEIPRIFTDDEFMKEKLKYVEDPFVRNFWVNEMGQTSDFHKSEMLGWFVGKFGAFMTNATMRNILGQNKSVLNLRKIMDEQKILLVNLSKGEIGEMNMMLLGMILVAKIQMAAMSRADIPEEQRKDFYLYVDEFQNFATDSFASILSEARKFRLNLTVANQFIGQLKDEIRNAVFGNVGNLISFRVGNDDAEYLAKQFTPIFNESDLINMENYTSIAKVLIGSKPSVPFSMSGYPYPPNPNNELGKAIKELSRLKYGIQRDIVNNEINAKFNKDL